MKLDPLSGNHIDLPRVAVYATLPKQGASGRPALGLADE